MGRVFQTDFANYPRPKDHKGAICGFSWDGKRCSKRGAHHCEPRADRIVAFFEEQLTIQSGPKSLQPFKLEPFQEWDILRPLFGEVIWTEWGCYGRRFKLATIIVSRKNAKTTLLSGIGLYLLAADREYGAQIYTAAKNTEQAKLVFNPATTMVSSSTALTKVLRHNRVMHMLEYRDKASFFKVIPGDANSALGYNPHGVMIDEILNQPNGALYNALRTGMGTRVQPLMILASTETDKQVSFGAASIDEAERIQEDPSRAYHHFVYIRKTPRDIKELERLQRLFPNDPDLPVATEIIDAKGEKQQIIDIWDEKNWKWSNPGLGSFLKYAAMREEAQDAKKSKAKELAFKQFRLNMRVQSATRFIDLGVWDLNIGRHGVLGSPEEIRQLMLGKHPETVYAGLDLSSKLDLTAWVLLFPDGEILPRFWIPEDRVPTLTDQTGGKFADWVNIGWVVATPGDTIDYERVYADIELDATEFAIKRAVYDRWCGEPVRQHIEQSTGLDMVESDTSYSRITLPMNELERALKARALQHFGHPMLRWMADNLEAKRPTDDPDRVRPVKPDREAEGKHIDGMMGLLFAMDAKMSTGKVFRSAYEDEESGGLIVV